MEKVSLRESTSLIGKLTSTYLAVLSSRATAAPNKKDSWKTALLTKESREDFNGKFKMKLNKEKPFLIHSPDFTIHSDAAKAWGGG